MSPRKQGELSTGELGQTLSIDARLLCLTETVNLTRFPLSEVEIYAPDQWRTTYASTTDEENELLRLALTVTAIGSSRREFVAEIAHLPIGSIPNEIFQGQEGLGQATGGGTRGSTTSVSRGEIKQSMSLRWS